MTTGMFVLICGVTAAAAAVIATVIVCIRLRRERKKVDEHIKEWY